MSQSPIKKVLHNKPDPKEGNPPHKSPTSQSTDISKEIIKTINALEGGLQAYKIRTLVKHAQEFGPYLKQQRLETNQIRKFLDAVNRIKADLAQNDDFPKVEDDFSKVETEVVLLQPKLAYAAARQPAAKPLSEVMSAAIDKVNSRADFDRLVQLLESIIAYHKAEGGK